MKMHRGGAVPTLPRYMIQLDADRAEIERLQIRSGDWLGCYMRESVDSLILDAEQPIRLTL